MKRFSIHEPKIKHTLKFALVQGGQFMIVGKSSSSNLHVMRADALATGFQIGPDFGVNGGFNLTKTDDRETG